MERVTGGKVTEHGLVSADEKRRLADLVVEALIARPIFSKDSPALFHADPHAGNLFLTDDHRLALLDWSLVGSLGEPERVAARARSCSPRSRSTPNASSPLLEALAGRDPWIGRPSPWSFTPGSADSGAGNSRGSPG